MDDQNEGADAMGGPAHVEHLVDLMADSDFDDADDADDADDVLLVQDLGWNILNEQDDRDAYQWRLPPTEEQQSEWVDFCSPRIKDIWGLDADDRALDAQCVRNRGLAVALEAVWLSGEFRADYALVHHVQVELNRVWKSTREVEAFVIAGFPETLMRMVTWDHGPEVPTEVQCVALSMLQWISYRCADHCLPYLNVLMARYDALLKNLQRADMWDIQFAEDWETQAHSLVTLFLNLALNLTTPDRGLCQLQDTLVPLLLSHIRSTADEGDDDVCIFSALTVVIVSSHDLLEAEPGLDLILVPLLGRFARALESALSADQLLFEGLLWSARSPCMAMEKLARIGPYRAEFASSGALDVLLAMMARVTFTEVDTNWDDLHQAQRHAAGALWWLTMGVPPSGNVLERVEACLPGAVVDRTAAVADGEQPPLLLDCMLSLGLDAIFLDDDAGLGDLEARLSVLARLKDTVDGRRAIVLADVARMSTAMYGDAMTQAPLALAELARRRFRLDAGPELVHITAATVDLPQIARYMLYGAS
mmetsp:Transcript_18833/g.55843  ORF Transcript_18833/g.55843 Transcript_18833/m.55843 type:complete len:535 (+) Transcript_18833:358-1962(+)